MIRVVEGEPIAWFKTKGQWRNAGKHKVIRLFQIRTDGTIQVIDVSRKYISNQKSFGGLPVHIEVATQKEWNKEVKKLSNELTSMIFK